MATQSAPRRFNVVQFSFVLVIAVILGVGIPYGMAMFASEAKPEMPKAAPAAPAAATPPPKVDFFAAATVTGDEAKVDKDGVKASAKLGMDDATIVFLRAPSLAADSGGGGGGGGGRSAPSASMSLPDPRPSAVRARSASVGAGGAGGQGGGPRPARLPLTLKDSAGEDYSYFPEALDGGIIAVHVKKGYAKKPESLTLTEAAGGVTYGSWKIDSLPAPTQVLPESALQGQAPGEVQIVPGRGGRLSASAHLTMSLPNDEGVILHPVAASFTPIDTSRTPNGIISKAGESPFDGRFNMPNPKMAKRVSFDMETYQAETTTETVSFKSAHIESAFDQPYLVVDADETATSASGLKVTIAKQGTAPKRAPKKVHMYVALDAKFEADTLALGSVKGIVPRVSAEIVQPTPQALGLTGIKLSFGSDGQIRGANVFPGVPVPAMNAPAGTVKTGPVGPLTLKITIVRPKVIASKRIVLPVNPTVQGGTTTPPAGQVGRPSTS